MHGPALLLFDLGGVLIENATFDRLRRYLRVPLEIGALKSRWLACTAVRRFELGEIAPHDFAESFVREWALDVAPDDFLSEFSDWPRGFHHGGRDLLRTLRREHRVGCLSNSNVLHWQKFGGFAEDFDIALSSHILGAVKPDEEAFLRALAACQVPAARVWFFDDAPENVRTARRLGLRAFHVEGVAALRAALGVEGLLPVCR